MAEVDIFDMSKYERVCVCVCVCVCVFVRTLSEVSSTGTNGNMGPDVFVLKKTAGAHSSITGSSHPEQQPRWHTDGIMYENIFENIFSLKPGLKRK